MPVITRGKRRHIVASQGPLMAMSLKTSLRRNFAKYLETTDYSDATVTCGEFSLRVHQIVLSIHSGYFLAMFKWNCLEARNGVVTIDPKDMKPHQVEWAIKFLYTGNLTFLSEKLLNNMSVHETCLDLFAAGDYFLIEPLKDEVIRILTEYHAELADNYVDTEWFGNRAAFFKTAGVVYQHGSLTWRPIRQVYRDFLRETFFHPLHDPKTQVLIHAVPELALDALLDIFDARNGMWAD